LAAGFFLAGLFFAGLFALVGLFLAGLLFGLAALVGLPALDPIVGSENEQSNDTSSD